MSVSFQQQEYWDNLFLLSDRDRDGLVSTSEYLDFARRSNLDDLTMNRIWQLVDINEKGFVDRNGYYLVLKLIAMSQAGQQLNVQKALSFDGEPIFYGKSVESIGVPSISVSSISSSSTLTTQVPISNVSKEDIVKYDFLFQEADKNKDGFVDGNEGLLYFTRCGLPNETLAKIWDLSDIKHQGKLSKEGFRIAMHLIYMSLRKEKLPTELPGTLIEEMMTGIPNTNTITNTLYVAPALPQIEPYWGHPGLLKHN